jgi:pyruvate,water dikinase
VLRDFDRYTREALRRLGITPQTQDPIVGVFFARAFLNVSLSQEIGGQTASAEKHYMGAEEQSLAPKSGGALAKLRLALALPKTLYCLSRLGSAIGAADVLAKTPLREINLETLGERIGEHGAIHVLTSINSGAMFTILGKLTDKWLGDKDGELHGRLLRGLAGMDSARPAYDLWELSRMALVSPALKDVVARADAEALVALDETKPGVRAFRTRLEEFMTEHGHHSIQEMEVRASAWDEDHGTVLAMIRNFFDVPESASPSAVEMRARADREAASTEALSRLPAFKRPIFRYFLRAAQRWVPLREHTKSELIRAMHRRRRFLRARAEDLVSRGLLASAWDLYYLTWDEFTSLDAGTLGREPADAAIRRRRGEERQNRLVVLPETFTGKPTPLTPEPVAAPENGTLTGIAVSRGTVTGRARVILDPRADSVIHPGEILVAPVTDAGWTPLFTIAAGLVVDIGGALSHGSTVAREYGLPAVVNVKVGTQLIRTGDEITVDGTRGIVIVNRLSK